MGLAEGFARKRIEDGDMAVLVGSEEGKTDDDIADDVGEECKDRGGNRGVYVEILERMDIDSEEGRNEGMNDGVKW